MKKSAILIGFYYNNPEWKSLGGAIIDLYHAWEHCSSLGFEIKMINDFIGESMPDSINTAVLGEYVDVEIFDFCENQKEKMLNAENKSEFKKALIESLQDVGDVLFLYFSGHGDRGRDGLVLPDDAVIKWDIFFKIIISQVPKTTEICLVLDCCYPSHLDLPYQLVNKSRFRLIKTQNIPPIQQILLFTSSDPEEQSDSSDNGSLFTRFFFLQLKEVLQDKDKSLNLLKFKQLIDEKIRKKRGKNAQKVHIYRSHPRLPLLKSWLWSPKELDYLLTKK